MAEEILSTRFRQSPESYRDNPDQLLRELIAVVTEIEKRIKRIEQRLATAGIP